MHNAMLNLPATFVNPRTIFSAAPAAQFNNGIDPTGNFSLTQLLVGVAIVAVLVGITAVVIGKTKGKAESKIKDTDFDTIPRLYGANSPSGGPAANPSSVIAISYRTEKKLRVKFGTNIVEADVVLPVEIDDTKENGPTPVGEYLIDVRRDNDGLEWYNLSPRKEDNTGYYLYTQETRTRRDRMGLHPGTASLGCCTVKAPSYNTDSAWIKVRDILDKGQVAYRGQRFVGFLYVVQ